MSLDDGINEFVVSLEEREDSLRLVGGGILFPPFTELLAPPPEEFGSGLPNPALSRRGSDPVGATLL